MSRLPRGCRALIFSIAGQCSPLIVMESARRALRRARIPKPSDVYFLTFLIRRLNFRSASRFSSSEGSFSSGSASNSGAGMIVGSGTLSSGRGLGPYLMSTGFRGASESASVTISSIFCLRAGLFIFASKNSAWANDPCSSSSLSNPASSSTILSRFWRILLSAAASALTPPRSSVVSASANAL